MTNDRCPTCDAPITNADTPHTYLGEIRFCIGECVSLWFKEHDRRKRSIPVDVDRRAVLA